MVKISKIIETKQYGEILVGELNRKLAEALGIPYYYTIEREDDEDENSIS